MTNRKSILLGILAGTIMGVVFLVFAPHPPKHPPKQNENVCFSILEMPGVFICTQGN